MAKFNATSMMSLGKLIFRLPSMVPQEVRHDMAARHARNERIGSPDAFQFIGPGDENISLDGVVLEGQHDPADAMAAISDLMGQGQAHPLVDGLGRVLGQYIIAGFSRQHSGLGQRGQPNRTAWTINLSRVDTGRVKNSAKAASFKPTKIDPKKSIKAIKAPGV